MSETPKHASGKTDFELVEAAIDVAVNGADIHEDDEECPQDDTCECRDAFTINDGHRALVRMDREIASLREQVRALTEERDAFIASLEREAQVADALRARVAELEKMFQGAEERADSNARHLKRIAGQRDAYRDSLVETAHFYMEWVLKDGNSPGYNREKAATYGDKANAYRIRAETAESERDAAQQRAKAVEGAVRRVTREALEALEKMPTPTKEYEALATLQRNLLQRLREETDAAMAAATTNTEAP